MNSNWYIFADNQNYGPFTFTELQNMIHTRQILPETMLYHADLGQWTQALSINGLQFQAVPPAFSQAPKKKKRGCCLPFVLISLLIVASIVVYNLIPKKVHHLSLGKKNVVLTDTVDHNGGQLQINDEDSTLIGLTIDIPQNAYEEKTKFTISTREINEHDFGGHFNPVTPLIIVDNKEKFAKKPLVISIPVYTREDEFAMAFYYTDEGQLEALPLVHQNSEKLIIATKHFSEIVVSSIKKEELENLELSTGFQPGIDDWSFTNRGSQISPGGYCAGQTASMAYYYYEKRLHGAKPLHTAYDNNHQPVKTPDFDFDDSMGIRLASVMQEEAAWTSDYYTALFKYVHSKAYLSDKQIYQSFGYAMLVTGDPQLMCIFKRTEHASGEAELIDGHAILAYKLTKDKIYVCDPNYPGDTNLVVPFNGRRLGPYQSKTSIDEPHQQYNSFSLAAKTAIFDWQKMDSLFEEMEKSARKSTIGDGLFKQCNFKAIVDFTEGEPVYAVNPELIIMDDLAKARIAEGCATTFNYVPEGGESSEYLAIKCDLSVDEGRVIIYEGTKAKFMNPLNHGHTSLMFLPIHKGLSDFGLFFQEKQGHRNRSGQMVYSHEFVDFIRFQLKNGEEDITGTWKGTMHIENLDKVIEYSELLAEKIAWGLSLIIEPFLDEPLTEEQIREAAKAGVSVNKAALEPIPLRVTFEKKEENGNLYSAEVTMTVPTEGESKASTVQTRATYHSGKITFDVPYDDGSICTYTMILNDHNTASGEFKVQALGQKVALSGTCELKRP